MYKSTSTSAGFHLLQCGHKCLLLVLVEDTTQTIPASFQRAQEALMSHHQASNLFQTVQTTVQELCGPDLATTSSKKPLVLLKARWGLEGFLWELDATKATTSSSNGCAISELNYQQLAQETLDSIMEKLDKHDVTSYGVRILGVAVIPPEAHFSDWHLGYAVGPEYQELYNYISEVETSNPVLDYVRECAVGLMDKAWKGELEGNQGQREPWRELFLQYKPEQDQEMALLLDS